MNLFIAATLILLIVGIAGVLVAFAFGSRTQQLLAVGFTLMLFVGIGAYEFFIHSGPLIDKRTMITSTTTSASNSAASSVAVNVNGWQFYGKSGYKHRVKEFSSIDEVCVFLDGLDEGQKYGSQLVCADSKWYLFFREAVSTKIESSATTYSVDGKTVATLPDDAKKQLRGVK